MCYKYNFNTSAMNSKPIVSRYCLFLKELKTYCHKKNCHPLLIFVGFEIFIAKYILTFAFCNRFNHRY